MCEDRDKERGAVMANSTMILKLDKSKTITRFSLFLSFYYLLKLLLRSIISSQTYEHERQDYSRQIIFN